MPISQHPAFKPPLHKGQRIWRYLSFSKFASTIDQWALFFARLDLLGDLHEGSISRPTAQAREAIYRQLQQDLGVQGTWIDYFIDGASRATQLVRYWLFVNCWTMSDYESPAHWVTFGRSNEAVALQSTYARLQESFPDEGPQVRIGTVEYIDYDTEHMPIDPIDDFFAPALYKRRSFEHERELRAIIFSAPRLAKVAFDIHELQAIKGHYVPVDLYRLIENIYVAPAAPDWFLDLVQSTLRKHALDDKKVIRSTLESPPTF